MGGITKVKKANYYTLKFTRHSITGPDPSIEAKIARDGGFKIFSVFSTVHAHLYKTILFLILEG